MDLTYIEKMARKPKEEVSDQEVLTLIQQYIKESATYEEFERRRIAAIFFRYRQHLFGPLNALLDYFLKSAPPPLSKDL